MCQSGDTSRACAWAVRACVDVVARVASAANEAGQVVVVVVVVLAEYDVTGRVDDGAITAVFAQTCTVTVEMLLW